jgi:membrane fusion protein
MDENNQREPDTANANAPLPLFRPEVWDSKATQWFGPIRLNQPVPAWVMASVALCVTLGVVAFGVFGKYTKKLAVTGITMPTGGSVTISSLTPGIIVRSHVVEGQRVVRDQTLFEISGEQHVANGALASLLARQLDARQESIDVERRSRRLQAAERRLELDARLANLAAEETQAQQDIALTIRRQRLAQATVAKYEALRKDGFVSDAQVQQKMEDAIDIESRLGTLNRSLLQLRANRIIVKAERDGLDNNLSATLAQLDRSEAAVRQERAENQTRHHTFIKATDDGVVSTITNRPGQYVPAGQVLATLLPSTTGAGHANDEQEVHLYATSRAIGFARVGQAVRIRYRAFPYERFGVYNGQVVDISKTPLPPSELPSNISGTVYSQAFPNASGSLEGLYRIRVKPSTQHVNVYGKPQMLSAGMTLEADLMLETRRIWEWAFAPALALAAR